MKNEVNVLYSDVGCPEENHEKSSKEDGLCAKIGTRGLPNAKRECYSLDCYVGDIYTSRSVWKYFRVLHVNIIGFSMTR